MFFILSGAFDGDGKSKGIEKIIEERICPSETKLGFENQIEEKKFTTEERKKLLYQITNEDLSKYKDKGMIRQLQGRISTIVVYPSYTAEELSDIFEKPKNSLMKQTQQAFKRGGINLEYTKEAIKLIGEEAEKLNTGARGLKSIISRFKDRYGFILGNIEAKNLTVTEEIINDPEEALKKTVKQTLREQFSEENDFRLKGIKYYITNEPVYDKLSQKIIETNTKTYQDLISYIEKETNGIIDSMKKGINRSTKIRITSKIIKGLTET